MSDMSLASIIITNHNYERFLAEAIDSALAQTHPSIEVIVVDDGSTDRSADVIAGYGDRVTPLFQENGGQTSAMNAGFAASSGDVACFLDADDTLLPNAVETAVGLFRDPDVVKVHWPLWEVNVHGRRTGSKWPEGDLPDGDFREQAARIGPDTGSSPPTSGNVWSRSFLDQVLPLPEIEKEMGVGGGGGDDCLSFLASLLGHVRSVREPLGTYRLHGQNDYATRSFEDRLRRSVYVIDHICALGSKFCNEEGVAHDLQAWRANSWFHRVSHSVRDLIRVVPENESVILVDAGQWGTGRSLATLRLHPFVECNGLYWGPPADDASAVRELEQSRGTGAGFIVFAWPAFWWLDYYAEFYHYLRSQYPCVLHNDRLVIFELRHPKRQKDNKGRR
jgi:glycosyltransferase involved in cell wall biosynthesis